MPDDQLHHRVVRAAADVRALVGGRQVNGHHPGQRDDQQDEGRQHQVPDAVPPTVLCAEEVHGVEGRQGHAGLQHFDVEAQPDQERAQQQVAQFAAFGGFEKGPRGQQQHEDQQAIDGVVALGGDGDGRDGQHQRSSQARPHAEVPPHQVVDQQNRAEAGQRVGQCQGEAVDAQEVGRDSLHPEAQRRLVHRHGAAGLESGVEEVVPRGQHGLDRGGVVGVADAVRPQLIEAQECAQQDDKPQPNGGNHLMRANLIQPLRLGCCAINHGVTQDWIIAYGSRHCWNSSRPPDSLIFSGLHKSVGRSERTTVRDTGCCGSPVLIP